MTKADQDAGQDRTLVDRHRTERYAVFVFGVLFLVIILTLIVWIPKPTIAQFFVFRLTLALAASGIGALTPGFIELNQPLPRKGLLRAGGALALFTLIWFGNPGKFAIDEIAPPPASDARAVIERAIKYTDEGQYALMYEMYSSKQRASISEGSFVEMFRSARESLGVRVKGPKLHNGSAFDEFMGNKGPFVAHVYLSRFENSRDVWAEAASVVAENGEWKMISHVIAPCEKPNCVVPEGF